MNVKELIEKYKSYEGKWNGKTGELARQFFLEDLKQLDEPRKVKVKKFVADWYKEHKDEFEYNVWDWLSSKSELRKIDSKFAFWLNDVDNTPIQTLVNMHQFGYEIEKESKYIVKVKATGQCLGKYYINNEILSPRFIYTGRHADSFTRKELEEADFSWVFDCDGVGVEEVE